MQRSNIEVPKVTDAQLVELSRAGNEAAFGELVQRHRHKCVHLASFVLQNDSDAEDQVQIAFLKAYRHLDQYHGEAEFSTWLTRIVINQCRMQMRARRRTGFLHFNDGCLKHEPMIMMQPNAESELAFRQLRQILRREMALMPQLFKNVIMLHYVRGLPLVTVAAQLGITVAGAKSRLRRARIELRLRIAKHYDELTHAPAASHSVAPPYEISRCRAVRAA